MTCVVCGHKLRLVLLDGKLCFVCPCCGEVKQ